MFVRHEAYRSLGNMDTEEWFFFSVIVVPPSRALGGITACRCRPFLPRVPVDGMVVLSFQCVYVSEDHGVLSTGSCAECSLSHCPTWGQSFLCAAALTTAPTWPVGKSKFALSALPTHSRNGRLDLGCTTSSYSPTTLSTGQVMRCRSTTSPPTRRRFCLKRFR